MNRSEGKSNREQSNSGKKDSIRGTAIVLVKGKCEKNGAVSKLFLPQITQIITE